MWTPCFTIIASNVRSFFLKCHVVLSVDKKETYNLKFDNYEM